MVADLPKIGVSMFDYSNTPSAQSGPQRPGHWENPYISQPLRYAQTCNLLKIKGIR